MVGASPDTDHLLRLSTCVLIEAHDGRQDSDRRYLSEASMALLEPPAPTPLPPRTLTTGHVLDPAADAAASPA